MDDVLRLAGALGVDLQGVVQEKDLGKLDEVDEVDEDNPVDEVCEVDKGEEVDEDRDGETSMDWDEVEEVKLNDTLDDIPFSLDETVKDILDEPGDEIFEIGEESHGAAPIKLYTLKIFQKLRSFIPIVEFNAHQTDF